MVSTYQRTAQKQEALQVKVSPNDNPELYKAIKEAEGYGFSVSIQRSAKKGDVYVVNLGDKDIKDLERKGYSAEEIKQRKIVGFINIEKKLDDSESASLILARPGDIVNLDSASARKAPPAAPISTPIDNLKVPPPVSGINVARRSPDLASLLSEIKNYSGAKLVFDREKVHGDAHYDKLPSLSSQQKIEAAKIVLAEIKKYPPNYLDSIGLKTIGVFAACIKNENDGYHSYSKDHGGYMYYGVCNGEGGIVGSFYSPQQLAMTLAHEIFHHVDSCYKGQLSFNRNFASDDQKFAQAINGQPVYAAPPVSGKDLHALRERSSGNVLEGAVGSYSGKSFGEDQAETARWMMLNLSDALVQVIDRPNLPGSQRILHIINQYADSTKSADGANFSWFLDKALGREDASTDTSSATSVAKTHNSRLNEYLTKAVLTTEDINAARKYLGSITSSTLAGIDQVEQKEILKNASELVYKLNSDRIRPSGHNKSFVIWGSEEYPGGPNKTLQLDAKLPLSDIEHLRSLAKAIPGGGSIVESQAGKLAGLVSHYRDSIDKRFSISEDTNSIFQKTISALNPSVSTPKFLATKTNPYLSKVDEAIDFGPSNRTKERNFEANIRKVQPSCVAVETSGGRASGVNLTENGKILTNAHVANRLGETANILFPDGKTYLAECIAIDKNADLAIFSINASAANLPFANLASKPAEVGEDIVCIGNPGNIKEPFHVSVGQVHDYKNSHPWGALGGISYTAWTYWGSSGSPLFNENGEIVALHNTWDSRTNYRHGVPLSSIKEFLAEVNKQIKLL